jgi:predicted nucleic acid-binding protein
MKLPDTSVLLYAVDAQAAQHGKAAAWLEAAYASPNGVAFPGWR